MAVSEGKFLGMVFIVAALGGVLGAVGLHHSTYPAPILPKPQRLNVTASDLLGSDYDKSKPILVEFMDYECPPCKFLSKDKIPQLLARTKLTLVIRNYPLKMHKHAFEAAIIAECAKSEGKFDTAHEKLLKADPLDSLALHNIAKELSIDKNEKSEKYIKAKNRVLEDKKLTEMLKLPGTPSFILCKTDGTVWLLPLVFEQIDTVLSEAIK